MLHGLRTVEVQKPNLGHIKAQGETKTTAKYAHVNNDIAAAEVIDLG